MEKKFLKIKDSGNFYSFRYYRYKMAEWLHKFVNFITWTRGTKIGYAYRFSQNDLYDLMEVAKANGVTYEEEKKEFIDKWHKLLIDNLIKQLEYDFYLEKWANENEECGLDVGITLKMIAVTPIQIFHEDNAVTIKG